MCIHERSFCLECLLSLYNLYGLKYKKSEVVAEGMPMLRQPVNMIDTTLYITVLTVS